MDRDEHQPAKSMKEKPEKEGKVKEPEKHSSQTTNALPKEDLHLAGCRVALCVSVVNEKRLLYFSNHSSQMPYLTFESLKGLNKLKKAMKEAQGEKGQNSSTGVTEEIRKDESTDKKRKPDYWNEKLILEYFNQEAGLHRGRVLQVSRTLDEYYYHSLQDAERKRRNMDQVVYRYQKLKEKQAKQEQTNEAQMDSDESLICMVDQLWLWIIDESTCRITGFQPSG